jgi:PAS domain S-box-containing protein
LTKVNATFTAGIFILLWDRLARIAAIFGILAGSAGIVTSLAGLTIMSPFLGPAAVLTGIAIGCSIRPNALTRVIASACAFFVLVLTFRMPAFNAIGLTLIAAALLLFQIKRLPTVAQVFALLAGFLGLVGVAVYIRSAAALVPGLITAVFGAGTLCLRPDEALMALVGGRSASGRAARRIVLASLGVPFGLIVIALILQRAGVNANLRGVPGLGLLVLIAFIVTPVVWALRTSEGRYRQLFESNPHPMWVFDTETLAFLAVNDAAVAKYGYSAEEFLKMTIRDIRPPEDLHTLEKNVGSTPRGYEQTSTWRHLKKDGTVIDVEISSHDISFSGRQARLVLATDVTEKRRIEAQLLRAQRMESIGTLAGGIAHDVNNALGPIIMGIELLKIKNNDKATENLLDLMDASAQRGANIVAQVLTFARGIEGEKQAIQPRHLISNIESMILGTFPKSLNISTYVAKDLWTVMGDATQLDQVLLNLCVNGRDAMPDGGSLTIRAENKMVDEHYARLNLEAKAGPYVVIEVADTGAGIPPRNLEKIFEPFFTTKEMGKGTGLGLSTARAIVKSHDGFMNAYSELRKGTSFKVYLPAVTSSETVRAQARIAELPLGQGELILVVDDETAVRDISRITLESHNYRVMTAADGAQAVGFYAQNAGAVSAVLLDMMMPIMDGTATIRALESVNPHAKVIAASGLVDKVLHAGQSDQVSPIVRAVLAKPFTAETLLKTLHEVLGSA